MSAHQSLSEFPLEGAILPNHATNASTSSGNANTEPVAGPSERRSPPNVPMNSRLVTQSTSGQLDNNGRLDLEDNEVNAHSPEEHESSSGSEETPVPVTQPPLNPASNSEIPMQRLPSIPDNAPTGVLGAVATGVRQRRRHRVRQQNRVRQNEHQEPQPQQPPPPPPQNALDEDEFMMDAEVRVMKKVLDHESLPIARGAVALTICAWTLIFFPRDSENYFLPGLCCAGCVMLTGWAVKQVIQKPDVRLRGPFRVFEIRCFQLVSIAFLCFLFDTLMDVFAPQMGLFPFNIKDAAKFKEKMSSISNFSWQYFYQNKDLWFRINSQFFITSFSLLLLLNVPVLFVKMAQRNLVLREILIFELYANLYPTGYLVAPFFLMNLLAASVIPREYQSITLWVVIHILVVCWTVFILYGVWHYPEIPVVRPMGLPGYLYIETVTMIQLLLGMVFFEFVMLLRTTYFHLVPGAFQDSIFSPGFVTGPHLYLRQISEKKPPQSWKYVEPYPASFELVEGAFFLVCIIRHWKLASYMQDIHDRLEVAAQELWEN